MVSTSTSTYYNGYRNWRPIWNYGPYYYYPYVIVQPWGYPVGRPIVRPVILRGWYRHDYKTPAWCPCSHVPEKQTDPAKTESTKTGTAQTPAPATQPQSPPPQTPAQTTQTSEPAKTEAAKTEPAKTEAAKTEWTTALITAKSPTLQRMQGILTRAGGHPLVAHERDARVFVPPSRDFLHALLECDVITKEQYAKIAANLKAPLDPAVKQQIIDKTVPPKSREKKFDKAASFDDLYIAYLKTARDEFIAAKMEPPHRIGRPPDSDILYRTHYVV